MLSFVRSLYSWSNRICRRIYRHSRVVLVTLLSILLFTAFGLRWFAWSAYNSAERDLAADRPVEAAKRLEFVRTILWRSPEAHLLSARAARLIGDLPGAEQYLNRTIELVGRTERIQLEFLLLRVQTGEVDQLSGVLFDLVEKNHPETAIILESLARAYLVKLRYMPAYSCLSYWIERQPELAKPYQWRGWVLERLDNAPAARKDYDRALEIDPDLVPVRLRIAEMYLEDKQAPKALPHLEHCLHIAPRDAHVQARLGACQFLLGQFEPARRNMEAALIHLPNDPALLVALAELELQEGRNPEAETYLHRVLATDPSDTEALYKLASLLGLEGRSEESAKVMAEYDRKKALVDRTNDLLQAIAKSKAPSADDSAEVGRALLEIGREKLGIYWLEKAIESNPGHIVAHGALARHYEKTGDPARAAEHRRLSGEKP